MAVEASRIKARLRAKFPKANLSKKRIDEISAKLAKKPEDNATDAEIDEILEDYNENGPMTFEEIAKQDDRLRLAAAKSPNNPNPSGGSNDDDDDDDDDQSAAQKGGQTSRKEYVPKWAKALEEKLNKLESGMVKDTISSKFRKDERVKGIPEIILKGFIPATEEEFEDKITELTESYKEYAEEHKLGAFGKDMPATSTSGKGGSANAGQVQQISKEAAEKIVKNL